MNWVKVSEGQQDFSTCLFFELNRVESTPKSSYLIKTFVLEKPDDNKALVS